MNKTISFAAAAASFLILTPQASAGDVWYYCASARAYYPYVNNCREPWSMVPTHPSDLPVTTLQPSDTCLLYTSLRRLVVLSNKWLALFALSPEKDGRTSDKRNAANHSQHWDIRADFRAGYERSRPCRGGTEKKQ